ncbi:MAG TPA: DUF488 domain-containing protein [Kofleriaceae bacterium]|nr:DUF488 domain-containing protein [Kofleriaceae bacterium]
MARRREAVFTIGYEGRSVDELIAELVGAGVDRVIDIRALPLSRRRGFSKTPLRVALAAAGIDYVHVKEAGNPYRELRDDPERCLALYRAHLDESPQVVAQVLEVVAGRRAALLCLEREPEVCHRSIVAGALAKRMKTRPVNL